MKSKGRLLNKDNKIYINNNLTNDIKEARGTILHEIQHYIQKVENLPKGTSILWGNEQYANSKGEIEAADTKNRRDLTKDERKKTIPESSKENPVHPNREAILNHKRNTIEKISEKLYNIFGDDALEIFEEENNTGIEKADEKGVQKNTGQSGSRIIDKGLDNSSFSIEENNKLRDKAKEEIGTTNNLREAGYLTNDGEYLDFSGKKQGARGDQRQMDHREIADIYSDEDYEIAEKKYSNMGSNTAVMQDFIDRGNIRLNGTGVEIASAPTSEQYNKLYDYLEHVQKDNGEIFIDLDTETKNRKNLEYNDKISINKIIKDIKEHYGSQTNTETNIKDSQGRTLSKEQQEYFKDSKIRNDKGELLEVYHGTNNDFTVFDKSYLGSASGDVGFLGDGFYFATHKGEADYYGGKSMKTYLNVINPYNIQDLHKYKGMDLRGEDSNPYIEIKNLVDMNPEWKDIKIRYGNTYGDIANATDEILNSISVEDLGETDNGHQYKVNVGNDFDIVNTINNYSIDELKADAFTREMRNKFGFINSSDVIQDITDEARMRKLNNQKPVKTFSEVLEENGYDGIIQGEKASDTDEIVVFNPNQIKNVDNLNPTSNDDIRYSQKSSTWQEHLEKNYKSTGTKTYFDEMRDTTKKAIAPIHKEIKSLSNEIKELKQEINSNKQNDLIQISKMNKEEASTTPKLPNVKRNTPFADKESSFYSNVTEKSKFLSEENRSRISKDEDVQYYSGISNEETMDQAYKKLQKGGQSATTQWFNKNSKDATAIDVAQGWILLKQYQDAEDYGSMVEVAKKMREIGTTSGQTVQAFNILSRLTPEGMINYAQSELTEAYNQMIKNKTKNWIDKHKSDFELNSDEVQFIVDNMKEVQDMEDGYEKRVKLAEIQKLMTDKLPTEKGRKIKSWMRISMLFNPKTQVRNVMGNALIAPVNYFGDIFASVADKTIAKKTGVRTTGNMNVKAILKGLKEGAYQATNDYRKGINTRDMEGNRFEIGEGKSFSEKNLIGKSLNRVDGLLNYVMDVGDRVFSQASFENSLQNQMKLNNTNEITQDMIDIARAESLQRTWNDNNNYTKFVLDVRRGLNKIGTKGYGVGDILIPFAKTPANLTKAIVDYSPVGLVQSIKEGVNLKRSLSNGQYNAQMQHNFVQKLGKATAGTMLYLLGYALAKSKITSGESDDDKDVANFMKNTLGISSYSIKVGDKSFTYDWAQPLAAPLAITSNIVNKKYKNKDAKELMEAIIDSLDTGGSILLEQSFLQSINDVLKSEDGVVSGLVNEMLELPARAIPTFSKQIADMIDGTQRQTYVKGEPVKTALNSAKAKIPVVSKKLDPTVDTMGRNIQKYGGKNNAFNVLLNPANVNTKNISSAAKEVYKVYSETDDKTMLPRVAPYSIDKLPLSTKQRADYQKIGGELVEKSINELIKNDDYKDLSNKDKAVVISKIVSYSSNKAKSKALKTKMGKYWNSVNNYIDNGGTAAEYYLYKVVDD
jgi:hypothetical protein